MEEKAKNIINSLKEKERAFMLTAARSWKQESNRGWADCQPYRG
jgi:hypothetical protein